MQNSKYQSALKDYVDAITLTASQADRIDSALKSVIALMLSHFDDAELYAQGSYSTDTLVKPLTSKQGDGKAGEFDIDIVVERSTWEGAEDALDAISDILTEDGTYGKMELDTSKNSCVRIEYAEGSDGIGFHVDLVPTKNDSGERTVAHRESDTWKPSDAKQFADWFNGKAEANPGIRQVALILKRLRDKNGFTEDLRSITILTLVVDTYYDNDTIMGDLLSVLQSITTKMSDETTPPSILNPVNAGEDLSDGLTNYPEVREFLIETRKRLVEAIADDDADALKEVFGTGFSYESSKPVEAAAVFNQVRPTRAYGVGPDAKANR